MFSDSFRKINSQDNIICKRNLRLLSIYLEFRNKISRNFIFLVSRFYISNFSGHICFSIFFNYKIEV